MKLSGGSPGFEFDRDLHFDLPSATERMSMISTESLGGNPKYKIPL
jgi:hypothetical protein